ncbi:MAG: A24 family peptidase [Thermoplasmatota archaeon]
MLWTVGAAIALLGTCIAAVVDVRTKEIPNVLTLGMIAAGAALSAGRILMGEPWLLMLPSMGMAVGLAWLLWRAGLYGGGDAKLMMGIGLLVPLYPDGMSFLPTFFVMLALASFVHYFIFGLVALARQHRVLHALLFAAVPVGVALAAFYVVRGLLPWPHLVALLSLALAADLVSPLLPYRRIVAVDGGLEGMYLAETVGLRDGEVARDPVPSSLLRRVVHGSVEMDEVIAAPGHLGVQPGDIERLRGVVDEVEVFPAFPFAPVILAALLLALVFGNIVPLP